MGSAPINAIGDGDRFGPRVRAQLLYVSRVSPQLGARISDGFDELELLAAQAAANNGPLGVTGLLLYNGGNFMQLLEGDAFVIMDLFESITHDPRHDEVERLAFGPSRTRLFGNWRMGVCNVEHTPPADRERFYQIIQAHRARPDDAPIAEVAQELLVSFKQWLGDGPIAAA